MDTRSAVGDAFIQGALFSVTGETSAEKLKEDDYLLDRKIQKVQVYAGIPFGPHTQDAAVTESMGAISDRENEHLGVCDLQPTAMRKLLFQVIKDVQEGRTPPGVVFKEEDNNFAIDLVHATVPNETDWTNVPEVQTTMLWSGPPPKK